MRIGIVSDIHGNIEAWQKIMNGVFKDVDKILIAGDLYGAGLVDSSAPWYQPHRLKKQLAHIPVPLFCIRGNCDANLPEPEILMGDIFNKKYYMCHGQQCTSEKAIENMVIKHKIKYFIYGHTHEWRLENTGDFFIINPGSPTLPNSKDKLTVAIIDDDELSIYDINSQKKLAGLKNQ